MYGLTTIAKLNREAAEAAQILKKHEGKSPTAKFDADYQEYLTSKQREEAVEEAVEEVIEAVFHREEHF